MSVWVLERASVPSVHAHTRNVVDVFCKGKKCINTLRRRKCKVHTGVGVYVCAVRCTHYWERPRMCACIFRKCQIWQQCVLACFLCPPFSTVQDRRAKIGHLSASVRNARGVCVLLRLGGVRIGGTVKAPTVREWISVKEATSSLLLCTSTGDQFSKRLYTVEKVCTKRIRRNQCLKTRGVKI